MLEGNRQLFEQSAIENWRQLDKNTLCNLYIEHENDAYLSQRYLAGIVLKYWNKIFSLYKETQYSATVEECYNMVIDGIMYALRKRKWLDPTSSVYLDKNGPDKCINRKIKCIRKNSLIFQNRKKRQANLGAVSIEALREENENIDYQTLTDVEGQDNFKPENRYIKQLVQKYFLKQDYMKAFLIDAIINADCFKRIDNETVFNKKRIVHHFNTLDGYYKIFAKQYSLNENAVFESLKYVTGLSSIKLNTKLDEQLIVLKHVLDKEELC